MTAGDLDILSRAHALFGGEPGGHLTAAAGTSSAGLPEQRAGAMAAAYRDADSFRRTELASARQVDAALTQILATAYRDHREANRSTGAVLADARADSGSAVDNPIAARELLRRRIIRLRSQRAHVLAARRRALRRRAALRALRYRRPARRGSGRDGGASIAVRAALSRLGRPYVWGATGPDRFDCSGLVQWAYAQADVPLQRTTYEQIHNGVPIARSQVRPGDLVFPHAGHVQLAIGGNLVVEAPHAGATVQISQMGSSVAIRRPV